ncbi:DinB family protein [Paenibacillus beijingensis]|uniref:DinB-like domain-containing protein n=1 Tax=Paenibacillus beijingensis TaxID=1126833 RepID=A0A0D5NJG0_9BACL|nr:DinB family protein [Paenibacillus beijingensis]AJY75406.1 hypothetical protein VN24_13550 [Paenibacillus beijingensis]
MLKRPSSEEYNPYFTGYISLVPEGNVTEHIASQLQVTTDLLSSLTDNEAVYRYAPEKWSLKEVIGHVTDTERVMSYRLLRISRGDTTPLPGFDQDELMKGAQYHEWSVSDLLQDYAAVRRATLTLLRGIPEEAWLRTGTVSDRNCSARALAYIIAGHELHHLNVIREKYLPATV